MPHTITEGLLGFGSPVRLSFADATASNHGFVTRLDHTRESDGMRFWRVVFGRDTDEAVIVPECLLVPVCGWEERFIDFDGAWASMPCGFNAARVLRYVDPLDPDEGPAAVGYCLDHALCATLDLQRESIAYEVDEVEQ